MNKTLHICYVLPRFYPFRGGAEQNIFELAKRMVEQGHEVTVFTAKVPFKDEILLEYEVFEGIRIHRLYSVNQQLYAGFYPSLIYNLLQNKFDIIHSSGFGFLWIETCLLIKKIFSRNTKFINTPHGPFMAFTNSGIKLLMKKVYSIWLKTVPRLIYNKVIAVVDSQSEWINKDYGIPKDRIITILNGIDSNYIENKAPDKDSKKVTISYIGRMEEYKGVQNVIEVINKIKNDNPELINQLEFLILGRTGNFTNRYKQLIEKYRLENIIKIYESPTDDFRDDVLKKSSINILPSKWEATGIVLLEAMAKGNVIITTYQNEAYNELVKEGITGYAYDFNDLESLYQIITKLIEDRNLREGIIKYNLEFVKTFTQENSLNKYLTELNSLILD